MSLEQMILAEIHNMVLGLAKENTNMVAEVLIGNQGATIVTGSGKRYLISLESMAAEE